MGAISTAASSFIVRALPWVIRGVRAANVATTPAKIHPVVLIVTTIVLGYIIDRQLNSMLREYEFEELRDKLVYEAKTLDGLLERGDRVHAFDHVDILVRHALGTVHAVDKEIFERIAEFTNGLVELHNKYGIKMGEEPKMGDAQSFTYETDHLTQTMGRDLQDLLRDRDQLNTNEDYSEYLTLTFLIQHGTQDWGDLTPDGLRHAGLLAKGFRIWLKKAEEKQQATLSGQSMDVVFKDYAFRMKQLLEKRLADELLHGKVVKDTSLTLLQTACFINQTGDEALLEHGNLILSTLANNENQIRSILAQYVEPVPAMPSQSIELPPGGLPDPIPDGGTVTPIQHTDGGQEGAGPGYPNESEYQ